MSIALSVWIFEEYFTLDALRLTAASALELFADAGKRPQEQYDTFVHVYGYDITQWAVTRCLPPPVSS